MKLDQLQKKGLFTFYQDDGEDQISQYLRNKKSSLQQTFTKQYISTKLQKQAQQKVQSRNNRKQQKEWKVSKQMNKFSDITTLLEKNRMKRNHHLLNLFLKKSQKLGSNTQQLKSRLQELLNDEPIEKESIKSHHKTPQKQVESSLRLDESISIGKIKSKQKILLINAPKNVNKHLRSMFYSKIMGEIKQKDRLPKIDKANNSADLNINSSNKVYQLQDAKQKCLQPIKSDRRYSRNYFHEIQNLNRRCSLEQKGLMDSMNEKQKKLLQKFTQSIKFK